MLRSILTPNWIPLQHEFKLDAFFGQLIWPFVQGNHGILQNQGNVDQKLAEICQNLKGWFEAWEESALYGEPAFGVHIHIVRHIARCEEGVHRYKGIERTLSNIFIMQHGGRTK